MNHMDWILLQLREIRSPKVRYFAPTARAREGMLRRVSFYYV